MNYSTLSLTLVSLSLIATASTAKRSFSNYKHVLTAAGEEMYFRGIVQTELTERLHPNIALVVSSLLFGAWHIPNNGLGSSIGSTVGGGYLGYRYKSNGYDLGEVIATHFWINVVGNVVEFMKDPSGNSFVYKINWKL